MIKLAHISDIHLAPLPPLAPRELLSKRITGYINWRLNRSRHMHRDTLSALIDHMKTKSPDVVAVTGDLVNLAAQSEIENARKWLERLGPADQVCVVPGNHDAYVPGATEMFQAQWAPYLEGERLGSEPFPYIRRHGDIAIVGCNSGVSMPPFIAAGRVSQTQMALMRNALSRLRDEGLFRIVLIHHPPSEEFAKSFSKGLRGAAEFREAIQEVGAELVLHGHLHRETVTAIQGPDGEVPVLGVAAASSDASRGEQPARYNLFSIERLATNWSCTLQEYGYQRIGDDIVMRLKMRLY